ncbi:MAG: hypothetical protein Ct9H90mP19_5050 [Gammaproteobacteria bacterium]|nr:MAG: hypothetical protein Ct9H90mP19_5050 [Gammaproteobacteria bacterium]
MGANSFIANNSYAQIYCNMGISDFSNEFFKSFNNFMFKGMHFVTYPLTKNHTAYTLVFNNSKFQNHNNKNVTKKI